MKPSRRLRFGLWLERFRILRPLLAEYSHDFPEGKPHYVNRVSGTFMKERGA